MFDIGMSELLLIGIVALIVIGPKDLPALFHTLGRFTAKMRALGREFTSAMNAAARESGVDDVAKGLKGVANPSKFGLDKLNDAAERFEKWEPGKPAAAPKAPVDPDRAADIEKIRAATEKAGQARLDREAAAKTAAETPAAPAKAADKPAATPPAKATAKPDAAKPAAAKPAAAKPAARKAAAPKPASPEPASAAKTAPKAAAAKKPRARPATPKADET